MEIEPGHTQSSGRKRTLSEGEGASTDNDQSKRGRRCTDDGDVQSTLRQSAVSESDMNLAIDAVIARSQNYVADRMGDDELAITVRALSETIQNQQRTICRLEQRVSFLLSFLGIDSGADGGARGSSEVDGGNSSSSSGGAGPSHVTNQMAPSRLGPGDSSCVQPLNDPASETFTVVTGGRRRRRRGSSRAVGDCLSPAVRTINEVVLSTIYNEQNDRERRARSVIINGLAPVSGRPDDVIVGDLCQRELDITPDIRLCKRLGQQRENIRPILVSLSSSEQATALLSRAKLLRQSTDPATKAGVFINRNMTRAEATAAYEQRCRRRRSAAATAGGVQLEQRPPTSGSLQLHRFNTFTSFAPVSSSLSVVRSVDSGVQPSASVVDSSPAAHVPTA